MSESATYRVLNKNLHTVLDILLAVTFVGFGLWMTSLNTQIADIKSKVDDFDSRVTTNTVNITNLTVTLSRMENKLDRLVEKVKAD